MSVIISFFSWPFKLVYKSIIGVLSSVILMAIMLFTLGSVAQNSPDTEVQNSGKRLKYHHTSMILKKVFIGLNIFFYGQELSASYNKVYNKDEKTNTEIAEEVTVDLFQKEANDFSTLFGELLSDLSKCFKYTKILIERLIYENS